MIYKSGGVSIKADPRNSERGRFVVRYKRKYRTRGDPRWDKRSLATVFTTKGRANQVVINTGCGKVIRIKDV